MGDLYIFGNVLGRITIIDGLLIVTAGSAIRCLCNLRLSSSTHGWDKNVGGFDVSLVKIKT